jgi:hypothetical protein
MGWMSLTGALASALNGANLEFGTCTLHSYNEARDDEAEPKMGRRVDEKLAPLSSRETGFRRGHVRDVLWDQDG